MHLLTITGPTACGKTSLAVELAYRLNGEIISADSRQVFRGMDIGTGKDLAEYDVHGAHIPYHLIDIHDAGYEYNVYQFQNDFLTAYRAIVAAGKQPILCGGTGLYVEAVVCGYQLPDAPVDPEYRRSLEPYSDEELTRRLASYVKLHNHTDTETRERLVRALEIQEFAHRHPEAHVEMPPMQHLVVGVRYPREVVVERIGARLRQRLDEGMVDEVRCLLDSGVPTERLLRYGLEYRHITRYLQGQASYDDMYRDLYTDIRRFSKRQMTWFRRMERQGVVIHWIDGQLSLDDKTEEVLRLLQTQQGCSGNCDGSGH
ncbi:MAG: tRNA (adenosine(37)-N6)-dimethylallyltransferase MiaA [Bacteroidales bacterium]|nr:tRNA (adenosine(37)-N6)-dimethylallyltransferase MiaA [Bacteroidales bacterium]